MIVAKRVRAKDGQGAVGSLHKGRKNESRINWTKTLNRGGRREKEFGKSRQHRAMPFAYEILGISPVRKYARILPVAQRACEILDLLNTGFPRGQIPDFSNLACA